MLTQKKEDFIESNTEREKEGWGEKWKDYTKKRVI